RRPRRATPLPSTTRFRSVVFETTVREFAQNEVLSHEIFGAASLIVRSDEAADLVAAASGMEGQLTATLHLTESDHETARAPLPEDRKSTRLNSSHVKISY